MIERKFKFVALNLNIYFNHTQTRENYENICKCKIK